jgi:hypothetical protein
MIDAELLEEIRRALHALRSMPEWQRDLERAVPTDLVRSIVADNRSQPSSGGSMLPTVSLIGAGKVSTPDVGPKYRPYEPPEEPADRSGWRDAPKVDAWRPPGIEHMDRMMDQQDAIDRAARARELAGAAAIRKAEAELAKQPEPKPTKEKGQK